MAQSKYLTNNATLQIKANGDVFIKRRRMLGGAGLLAGLLLALLGLAILKSLFSSFNIGNLLFAVVLLFSSYAVIRSAWRGFRQPNILIEKSAQRISLQPTLMGGEAREWSFSQFSGVAVWRSGQIQIGDAKQDVFQAGLITSGGQPMSLVEIPAKKCDKVVEILTEATGLGTIQVGQK